MKPHKHRQSSPFQTLVSFLIVLQISFEIVLGAQRYLSTFGFVSELRTQKNSLGLIIGDFNGDDVSDLASFGGYQVRLFYQHPDSMSFTTSTLFTKRQIVAAASAKLNRDKITDIILILDDPPTIAVYIGKQQGIFYLVSEKEIPEIPENLIATDINDDRKADLVFYGKKTLGADVYLSNGNGTFRDRIIFFPEYSFSSMTLTNLHNIGATDIIASNWISNEVLIFSNYGKMKFSDPSVLSFSSEPVFVKCTHIDSDRALDLVVCTSDENKIYTYLGDGLGGFQQSQMLTFEFQPVGIRTGDTNSDGTDDLGILSLSTQSLHLLLNSGKGLFEEDIPFFGGMNPAQLEFYRHGKSSYINAAIIDTTNNRIRILFNANRTIRTDEELKFGVGVRPAGLVTTDINDDGWDDILIANSGSNNLSLLLNDGSGYFSGQISFSFTHSPTTLSYFSQNESTKIILSTSSSSNKISVMELNPKTFSHMLYHLPSHGESDILEISETEDLRHLAIYVFERDNNRKESNLIKFERIDGHRFTQRYYSLTPSFHPISACMGDYEGSQNKQFTFALYDKKQQKEQIFQSKQIPSDEFTQGKAVFSIDTPSQIDLFLKRTNIDNDKLDDLILNLGEPENKLYILFGRKDSLLHISHSKSINNIMIETSDKLKFYDMNNDEIVDMIYQDKQSKSLQVRLGRGDGIFFAPVQIASLNNMGDFSIADLNKDSNPELIMTDIINGIVKVIPLHN